MLDYIDFYYFLFRIKSKFERKKFEKTLKKVFKPPRVGDLRGDYFFAITSISTFAPLGKSRTAKALLAGYGA